MSTKIPWRRLTLEAVVVVGSVYVAIVLEGASADRARQADAVNALRTLRAELELDRSDLSEILEAQRDRDVRHRRIDRWLSTPAEIPGDSLTADLHMLFSVNRTMYPRSSAWATMVASGQLSDLGDPELVARLANFYENLNARLEYNGALYDQWVTNVAQSAAPRAWDRIDGRLRVSTRDEVHRFRSELLALHDLGYNFIGLLEDWEDELDALIGDVDGHLAR